MGELKHPRGAWVSGEGGVFESGGDSINIAQEMSCVHFPSMAQIQHDIAKSWCKV